MKYIKLFEQQNTYFEIDNSNEFEPDCLKFSTIEKREIKNVIDGLISRKNIFTLWDNSDNRISLYTKDNRGNIINFFSNIFKNNDEWYYIVINYSNYSKIMSNAYILSKPTVCYYKCDQLSGLIDCLKSELRS